jgi:hypothetical protein
VLVQTVKDLQAEVEGIRTELGETRATVLEMRQILVSGTGQLVKHVASRG